jgi:DNA-binding MarR family transcriptional regulator
MDAAQEVSMPGAGVPGPGSTATATGTSTAPPIDCAEFSAVLERLLSAWRRLAVPGELSPTAAFTLARLSRDGASRLTDLANSEHVTQPAMTQLVSRLEAQGLAERFREPGDARVVKVRVTGTGEALVASRRAARAARLTELLAMLPPGQQAALAMALPALRSLAEVSAQ